MKTNYVLIDYENVQPEAMAGLCEDHFKVLVFVGESQAKVTFDVASALQKQGMVTINGTRVSYSLPA